jgi:membrane peptidoglycan carboxypeptidase
LSNGYDLNSVFTGHSFNIGSSLIRNEFDKNYGDKKDNHQVILFKGLEQSINTVFVDLAQKMGPAKIRSALVAAGIPNDAPGLANVPVIPLGTFSVPPTVVANAYGTLCGSGRRAVQHVVDHVMDSTGNAVTIEKRDATASPVFSAPVRSDVLRAMENVVQNGTGTAAKALGRPVAGKTGTHQNITAWFNGCTPQLAASVDYFRGAATTTDSLDGVGGLPTFFGALYPAQTWTTFMQLALKGQPTVDFKIGPGVHGTLDLPTATPTVTPTATPTELPTGAPTGRPTEAPTGLPTGAPTGGPGGHSTPTATASSGTGTGSGTGAGSSTGDRSSSPTPK